MNTMELETPKGMKDFLPEEEILRQEIMDSLKEIFELYGFSPMDTPAVEKYDILSSKYAGGEEILNETFKLHDQGKRQLGLRYDLTVPFARVVGMNPKMKLPFKRYQMGKVWRDGPIGLARYREFIQCDIDVVGAKTMDYDAELILLAQRFFLGFGLETTIRLNNRKVLDAIMDSQRIPKELRAPAILSIDKLEKFGRKEVERELKEKGLGDSAIAGLIDLITMKGTNDVKLNALEKKIADNSGLDEIRRILARCKGKEIVFDPSLARGLSYYTGTILEVFLKGSKVTSAVCAGGRYDNLIGSILGSGEFPTVGISFGLSRIYDALKESREGKKTVTDLYIIPIGTLDACIDLAERMRDEGIRTEVDLVGRGPSKNMKYAHSLGIPFVAFVGEEELAKGEAKVKDMVSGEERFVALDSLPEVFKKG